MSRTPGSQEHARVGVVTAALATALALSVWGFTVDDALIIGRYAHHVAVGVGYRMNPGGPPTDGVTPLGYVYLLAPFAREGATAALFASKLLGFVGHLAAVLAVTRVTAARGGPRAVWAGPVAWALSAPAAAWAVAGLETGLVTGLVGVGVALRAAGQRGALPLVLLGAAAGLRPELLPLALVVGGPAVAPAEPAGSVAPGPLIPSARTFGRLTVVALPFVVAACVRAAVFGQPAPLSSLAKRPDLALGAGYAAACALLTGFVGIVAPRAAQRCDRYARFLLAGVLAHLGAVTLAGGDWMPVSRLMVPALPVLALAVAALARAAAPWAVALRFALAVAGEAWVWLSQGPKLGRVGGDRADLIAELSADLRSARVVACLDVGWVGAAAPQAAVVDLAGVTDPDVARLPGAHTQKRLPEGFLEARQVDTLLLEVPEGATLAEPWTATPLSRGVERYLATEPGIAERFEPVRVAGARARYLVLRRRSGGAVPAPRAWSGSEL